MSKTKIIFKEVGLSVSSTEVSNLLYSISQSNIFMVLDGCAYISGKILADGNLLKVAMFELTTGNRWTEPCYREDLITQFKNHKKEITALYRYDTLNELIELIKEEVEE